MHTTDTSGQRGHYLTGIAAITLAGAGLVAGPSAAADQDTGDGGAHRYYTSDTDDAVAERKQPRAPADGRLAAFRAVSPALTTWIVCNIPESLDAWSRRLIASQACRIYIVPAWYRPPAAYRDSTIGPVGHCGHHVLHLLEQPKAEFDLPVPAWYTPTSC